MKNKLIEFLKKHRALRRFKKAFTAERPDESVDEWLNEHRNDLVPLEMAFVWRETKEGHKYWESLADKYLAR